MDSFETQIRKDAGGNPILPDKDLRATLLFIAEALSSDGCRFTDIHGDSVGITPQLGRVLAAAAQAMADDRAVVMQTLGLELGIRQAAEVLNVSEEWLAREAGDREIPSLGFNMDRFDLAALLDWKRDRDQARQQALAELTEIGECDYHGEHE